MPRTALARQAYKGLVMKDLIKVCDLDMVACRSILYVAYNIILLYLRGVVAPIDLADFSLLHMVGQYIQWEVPLVRMIEFDYFCLTPVHA